MRTTQIMFVSLLLTITSCKQEDTNSFAYGNFEATEIMVSAQTKGEILKLTLEEGDELKKDASVGLIDTTDLHLSKQFLLDQKKAIASQLESIQANISIQQQQLENNRTKKQRIHMLFAHKAATQKQMDDIDGLVALNEKQIAATRVQTQTVFAQMKTIDSQMAQVSEHIRKSAITNPVAGTVLVKYAEMGELTIPGKPLYKLADLKKLNLKAYISGDQLSQIKIGQKVKVLFDATKTTNRTVDGKIIWVSSTAEFTPKTIQTKEERVNLVYAVKVEVKNDGAIKIGMPGEFNLN